MLHGNPAFLAIIALKATAVLCLAWILAILLRRRSAAWRQVIWMSAFGALLALPLLSISLPVLALWVAIPVALGRTSFLPPLTTWYGAMLFAIVPLRNILPGSPPYGSWVDQAIVLWVLIGLVAALTLFLVGWWRQRDRKTPTRT